MSKQKSHRKIISKRLSELKQVIAYEYNGSIERITNPRKQDEWIYSNYDRFESPRDKHNKSLDNSFKRRSKHKRRAALSYYGAEKVNKVNFEEYKRAKSEQRDREVKFQIVKDKITTKIKIRAKKPIYMFKSFGRQPKAYDTEVRLKAKRPQTAFMSRNIDLRKFLHFVTISYAIV